MNKINKNVYSVEFTVWFSVNNWWVCEIIKFLPKTVLDDVLIMYDRHIFNIEIYSKIIISIQFLY